MSFSLPPSDPGTDPPLLSAPPSDSLRPGQTAPRRQLIWIALVAVGLSFCLHFVEHLRPHWQFLRYTLSQYHSQYSSKIQIPPLAMPGGDPHLRALMRTISASESNTAQPYHVIFGGQHVDDLSRHPNLCVRIPLGPNRGNCSTAAGRYQFLNTTWAEKAAKYHPQPQRFLLWKNYSFQPHYQDRVLYRWLSDERAWGVNLIKQLKAGEIHYVLKTLSPTWTSLGYGIEDNVMSPRLPKLYQTLLEEELAQQSESSDRPLNLKTSQY